MPCTKSDRAFQLPFSETAEGGLAATPTGRRLQKKSSAIKLIYIYQEKLCPLSPAVFFDLDGTLVDSSIGIHNAFTHTFKELGVPSPDAKTIRGFMGPPLESSFCNMSSQGANLRSCADIPLLLQEKGIHEAQLFPE